MIGARKGSPLAVGHGDGEMYLGSDAIALAPFTDTISYLEDGDWVVLSREVSVIYDENNVVAHREAMLKSGASSFLVDKANYRHFMAKEIHEQPEVVGHTLARYRGYGERARCRLPKLPFDFADIQRISIVACGTASYAGYVAKYWFERLGARAGRGRCRLRIPLPRGAAAQGGSRDLHFAVRRDRRHAGGLALCQGQGRSHAVGGQRPDLDDRARKRNHAADPGGARNRRCLDQGLHLPVDGAGLAGGCRRQGEGRTVRRRRKPSWCMASIEIPRPDGRGADDRAADRKAGARTRQVSKDVLYLGRGTSYPLALEGALKLKEISYIHAEGYAAGELKHGPIALIDENMPVVVIAPFDRVFEKTVSNMQEVAARGGNIILMTDAKGAAEATVESLVTIILPDMAATFTPMVYAIPVQLLAYHTAVIMGTDVDQPRNLAKSVTVE